MIYRRPTILHSETSAHGNYRVVDTAYNNRPARILYGTDNSPQSGLALDDNEELLFDYNQRFLEMIMSHQPHSMLIIGGGVGTLATAAFRLFPDLTIDMIEIDGLLVELGRRFFDLPQSPQLQPIIDDAFHYLMKSETRYDTIIIDAFLGYTVPPHLLQHSVISEYRQHLTKDGVVAINFISEYKRKKLSLAHEIVAAFSEVFPHIAVYQSDPEYPRGKDQNLILAASNSEIHFDYLQSREVTPV